MTLRSDTFFPLLRSNDTNLYELSFAGKFPTRSTLRLVGDALRTNTFLKRLDLSHNNLTDEDIIPFLQLLRYNNGLLHLDLSHNPELSDTTGNELIDCVVNKNFTLSSISLDGTGISAQLCNDATFLMKLNKFPRQLKPQVYAAQQNDDNFFSFELTYDISDPKVYNEESTQLVANCLAGNTTVRTLRLNRCAVGDHCIRELRPLFRKNVFLRRVFLRQNMIGTHGALALVGALTDAGSRSMIEELDLGENEIEDEACVAFVELLKENHSLRIVNLEKNRVSSLQLDRLRAACALNSEPVELKPLIPRLTGNDPTIAELDVHGVEDVSGRGPGRGYYSSLGAAVLAEALLYNTVVHTVDLSRNHIGPEGAEAIATLISRTQTITSIDLSRNPISDEGGRKLVLALRKNDSVVSLRLADCNVRENILQEAAALCHLNAQPIPLKKILQHGETSSVLNLTIQQQPRGKWPTLHAESMPYVLSILQKQKHLQEIHLADNLTLGDEGVGMLIPVLRAPDCNLRKVVLCNTGITDQTVSALTDAVSVNYVIRSLVVTPNYGLTTRFREALDDAVQLNQYPPTAKDLVPLLRANVSGITTVSMVRGPDAAPFGDDVVRVICAALMTNTTVTKLAFVGHRLSNRGMGYCCELLMQNETIQSLDVSNNDIGPDGATEFALLLDTNKTIKECIVSGNPLTEAGGLLILRALQMGNRTLTSLSVNDCRILPPTAAKISALIAANGQGNDFRIHVLDRVGVIPEFKFYGDVTTGFLDDDSMHALLCAVQCLPTSCPLTKIQMLHNHIGDKGAALIAELMLLCPQLHTLDLSYNNIGPDGAEKVLMAVGQCASLESVVMKNCPCWETYAEKFTQAIHLNRESSSFVKFYQQWRSRLVAPPASSSDAQPPLAVDFSGVLHVRSSSVHLFEQLLMDHLSSIQDRIAALNLSRCDLEDDDAIAAIIRRWAKFPLLAVSLEGLPVGGKTCAALLNVAMQGRLAVCLLSDDVEGAAVDALREAIRRNRVSSAANVADALLKRGAMQQDNNGGKHSQRETFGIAKFAAGSPMAAVRALEDEQFVEKSIMQDALEQMPKRSKYVRGSLKKAA